MVGRIDSHRRDRTDASIFGVIDYDVNLPCCVRDDKNTVLTQLEETQSLDSEHLAESQLTRLTEDLKKSEFLAKTRTAELQE